MFCLFQVLIETSASRLEVVYRMIRERDKQIGAKRANICSVVQILEGPSAEYPDRSTVAAGTVSTLGFRLFEALFVDWGVGIPSGILCADSLSSVNIHRLNCFHFRVSAWCRASILVFFLAKASYLICNTPKSCISSVECNTIASSVALNSAGSTLV